MATTVEKNAKSDTEKSPKLTDKEASTAMVRCFLKIQRLRVGKDSLKLTTTTRDSWIRNPRNLEQWYATIGESIKAASAAYNELRQISGSNPGASITIRDTKSGYSRTVSAGHIVAALDRDESSVLKCDFAS